MLLRDAALLETRQGSRQVVVDLRVDLLHRSASLAFRCAGRGFGIHGYPGPRLVLLVGLLERLDQHEIGERPGGVGLRHDAFQFVLIPRGGMLDRKDVVDVADDLVKVFPCEVTPPDFAGIAHTGLVVVVLPEPSGTLRRLDHVVAHHLGAQRHGHVAEALVGVGRHEVDTVIHRGVDSVHGHLDGVDILEDQTFVHLVRRIGLHQVTAAGQTGAGHEAKEYVSDFFHRGLEF